MSDELVPLPSALSPEQLSDLTSEIKDSFKVSPELALLLERGIHSNKLPKGMGTAKAAQAMQQAFEMIGGVPRLMLWADANPDKFYALWARMIPQTVAPVVAELPSNQNNDKSRDWPTWLTARRLAYQESQEVASDVMIKGLEHDE
jgi:hypothetical protein